MKTNKAEIFINEEMAWMAAQSTQTMYMKRGYYTVTTFHPATRKIEISVHFDLTNFPTLPTGYLYTEKSYSSHEYYSEIRKSPWRVRVLSLVYEW